jgi:hypothetical protein
MEGTAPSPLRPKRNVILFYYIPVKVGWESNPNSNCIVCVSGYHYFFFLAAAFFFFAIIYCSLVLLRHAVQNDDPAARLESAYC